MKQLGLGWDCNLHFLPLTFHKRFGISRLFASVCAVWPLAPRRPAPAHPSFVFRARPRWACGARGVGGRVGETEVSQGTQPRPPGPPAPTQGQRLGAGPVSAARISAPGSTLPAAGCRGRSCPPAGWRLAAK